MAKIELLVPKILIWEGGFVQDPLDKGGATNMGVTIATYRQVFGENQSIDNLKALTVAEFLMVLKRFYWDRWKADQIKTQCIADILVDWVWCSGKWGIIMPQRILNTDDDGVVGPITIAKINCADQYMLLSDIVCCRHKFIDDLIKAHPDQKRFEKGWKNRINDFEKFTK